MKKKKKRYAILLALSCKEIDLIAITITQGNVNETKEMGRNALYLLELAGRKEVPGLLFLYSLFTLFLFTFFLVYIGPDKPLFLPVNNGAKNVHGENGFFFFS